MKKTMKVDARKLLHGMVAENTVASYVYSWDAYLEFAGSLSEALKSETLIRWRQSMVAGTQSAATINTRLAGVKSVVRELYNHRQIEREVYWDIKEVAKLPKTALKERRRPNNRIRIEPEEMRKLCTAPKVSEDDPIALRDRALLMTLATTGARISEVIRMKVHDIITLPRNKYVIANVVSKRHAELRTVPLSPEAHNAILDWLAFRPIASPYIFTGFRFDEESQDILYTDKPIGRDVARDRIKLYGKKLGMPYIKSHDFRRFVGTQLAKKSLHMAQKVLGHASIATTADHYVLDDFEVGATDSLF